MFKKTLTTVAFIGATTFITGLIGLFREADENPRFVHDLHMMQAAK